MKKDEKACPACAETIKKAASVCKHCGYKISEEQVQAAKAEIQNRKRRTNWISFGVAVVLTLLIMTCDTSDDDEAVEGKQAKSDYVEAEFYWDDDTSAYKPQLVAAVNRIVRENDNCLTVDTGTLSKSVDRGTAANPVYFITCNGPDDLPFNVWFERYDATTRTSFATAHNIGQGEAVLACERAAKRAATNPQTVDFSKIMDVSYKPFPNGSTRLSSSFTAKNAFGVEGKYTIECFFVGQKLTETAVNEAM